MATVRDLITRALKDLTVLGEGDTATAEMMTDGLAVFNDIVDIWNASELMLYQVVEENFALTGAQSYTIGTGGTWNTTRPEHIERMWYRRDGADYPIEMLDAEGWASLDTKDDSTDWVYRAYYDAAFPLGKIYVNPKGTGTIYIHSRLLLTVATLDTTISLPAGYAVTLRAEIAKRLAGQFGREPPGMVLQDGRDGMKAIKARNNTRRKPRMCIEFSDSARGNIFNDNAS